MWSETDDELLISEERRVDGVVHFTDGHHDVEDCRRRYLELAGRLASSTSFQPLEIHADDESKMTLEGLVQHYINLTESEKKRKLEDVLEAVDFNQVFIVVNSLTRAKDLNHFLLFLNEDTHPYSRR